MISWTYAGLTHALARNAHGFPRTTCEAGSPRSPFDAGVWDIVTSLHKAVDMRESRVPTCLWCVVARKPVWGPLV